MIRVSVMYQKAMNAHGKEIMGDIPNYTNI